MKFFTALLLIFLTFSLSNNCFAQSPDAILDKLNKVYPYFSIHAGTSLADSYFIESDDQNNNLTFFTNDSELEGLSIKFGGAIGIRSLRGFSGEIEVSYRSFDTDTTELNNGNGTFNLSSDSSVSALSVMINGYYTFLGKIKKSRDLMISPFVGFGIGATQIKVESFLATSASQIATVSDSDWVGAIQIPLGVEFLIPDLIGDKGGSISIQYRFFTTFGEPSFSDSAGNAVTGDTFTINEFILSLNIFI